MTVDQIRSLQPALAALLETFRPCFKRVASFHHWERYIVGLITDLKRKSIEPIALAAGVAVRTLQEFLSYFVWDHKLVDTMLRQLVMDYHGSEDAIGVIDASAHAKQGDFGAGGEATVGGEAAFNPLRGWRAGQEGELRDRAALVVHQQRSAQSVHLRGGQRPLFAGGLEQRSHAVSGSGHSRRGGVPGTRMDPGFASPHG